MLEHQKARVESEFNMNDMIILSQFPRKDNTMKHPDWESLPIIIVAIAGIICSVLIYNNIHKIMTFDDLPEVHADPIYIKEELSGGHDTVEVETVSEEAETTAEEKHPILMDEELIAMVVHAEANNQPMIGKVAVAAVVLNRCDYFGLTVESVVYAKNQFAIADTYSKDDMRAVEIAMSNRDLFPETLLYFRAGHFHKFGVEWEQIGDHFFSLIESEDK